MSYGAKNRDTIAAAVDGVSESVKSSLDAEDAKPRLGDKVASFKFFLRVFAYNDTFGWALNIVAFVCMLASGIILPLMDFFFGRFVSVFSDFASGRLPSTAYLAEVSRYTLYFIYLFIAKFTLTYVWTILINITAIRATKRLRVDFVRQTLRQEISFFDAPSTSVSSQLASNGNLVSNGVSEKLGVAIQALASFVTSFAVALAVQWKLTLVILAVVPLNIVVTIICIVRDIALEHRIFDIYGQSGSLAEETIANIRTAHAFWAFPKLSQRFDAILAQAETVGRAKSLIYAILFPIEYFCVIAGYALAFWQGMRMYASGEINDPGTIVTVVFAVLVAAQALTQIAPQTVAMSKATAAAQDLFAVIDRRSAIDSLDSKGLRLSNFQGKIQMRGLRFAYPSRPDVWVLNGLDLFIPPNKITAIVGASGSGKSSIFGLLERWYSHSEGSIFLDDQRIEEVNLQWLRTNIRLVQQVGKIRLNFGAFTDVRQEPMLFSGTVFQNVADGLSGTNMEGLPDLEKRRLVCDACKAAFAHEFILALPEGYDTLIAERGASLSGGQKQRLVIARSIISNPRVLLLDEATSALDPKAEKIVQAALNNVASSRTMVVIAHRLSTVRDADNIVVMSRGQVIETGTHQQLMSQGHYARLVRAQDLGGATSGMIEPFTEHDVNQEELELPLTCAISKRESASSMKNEPHLGLLRGLYLVLREQQSLRWPMLATVICCILGGMSYPALAVLFSETMDRFNKVDLAGVNFFSLMFFVVALGNAVVYAVSGWLSNILAQTVMRHYRSELFHNTLRQNMEFFDHPEHSTGALVSRLAAEPTALQELLSFNVALLLINAVNLASSSVLAIATGWKLGLALVLGALPVLVGAGYVRIRLEFRFEQDTAARFAASSGIAAEAVMGVRTVASLVLEKAVVQRYEDRLKGIAAQAVSSLGWKMSFYALSQSVSLLAMAFGFWYGSRLVSSGEYSTVQFYTVFAAVIFSGESAALLFQYTTSISKARTAIDYIFRMRRSRSLTDDDEEGSSRLAEKSGSTQGTQVSFEEVDFAYSRLPRHLVLRGVNINICSGSRIAFVGASGSGKSTMISLLERFYDPCTGKIIADGRDVTRLNPCRYRRDVALVQQEPVLFQGSVRENIALGLVQSAASSPSGDLASEAKIIAACRDANAWDFIASLPQGLDTPCGGQGLSLSGGQRQRIALARALVRQPRLLLLDEATSALDTESEKLVKKALDQAAEGRTTVAVAHRLCTIRDADLILVFASGTVVESGAHDELVAQRGLYYEMVLGQSLDRDTS